MKNLFKKYLTQKVRNVISILIIIFGLVYIVNYSFYRPTYINKYIAMNIYKSPANNAFTDQNFYNCVIDEYNLKNRTNLGYTTNLSDSQLKTITFLSCYNLGITRTNGLEKMTSLTSLFLIENPLTSIDVSKNTALTKLEVSDTPLTNLDVSKNTALTDLTVYRNKLTSIDVRNNTALTSLDVGANQLTSIDVSKNIVLTELSVSSNQLTSIDVSKNTKLTKLLVSKNKLPNLDVSKNTVLTDLDVFENQLTYLDVSKNMVLVDLNVSRNQLTSLDVSKSTALTKLHVGNNQLTYLDVSKSTALTKLDVSNNQLTYLDVSKNTKLTILWVSTNQLTNIDVRNNTALTELSVGWNSLTSIDVSKNTALTFLDVSYNQLTSLDVSKSTALTELRSYDNQLTYLNLLNNTKLSDLYLSGNNFSNVLTRYVGDSGNANSAVKLPSHLEQSITWKSEDEKIAISDSDGVVTAIKPGTVNVVGTNKYYTTKTIVNVFEMTSDKYEIDNENLYIYVGNDNDVDTIKNNINVPDYIEPVIDIDNNVIKLIKNNTNLKEFKIIRINSNGDKIIGSDYIYTRHYNDISGLSCYNCNASIEDNNVVIKYNNKEIDRFKLIKFSNKYTLYCIDCAEGASIYTGMDNDEEIINNLAIINGNAVISNNKLKIIYNDNLLDVYDIRGFSTNYKVLDNNILYTGFNKFNINNISYRGNKITGKYSNNKFTVLYNNVVSMDNYDIITLNGNNMSVSRKNIDTEEIDYDTFISNLSVIDNFSYKVIYNNEEVTSGNIQPSSILNIYYHDKLIDKYHINSSYTFELDEDISVLEGESIIYDVSVGFTKNNLLDKVNTSGEVSILDKNMKPIGDNNKIGTGYIFRTIFENDLDNPLDYKLSVRGDVLGTGALSRDNAKEIAKHIIDKNIINGEEYLLAADYNKDEKIKMNDVMKILRDMKKQENP